MTVEDLIDQLSHFPKNMEVVDYAFDDILSVHIKTWVDTNYPYNRPDKDYVCLDCDTFQYDEELIVEEIKKFCGEEGMKYFQDGEDTFDKKYYLEGRQIRNHIIDAFPNIYNLLGGYDVFEDKMYEWTKKAIENE